MASILIVDDEPANRQLLTTVLRARSHKLIEAASGEEGLRLAREHRPNLVILDLHLPGMHGTEFLKALHADPRTSKIAVVLYTATRADAAMRSFMELARIEQVIEKPAEPETILRTVDRALR